jgi:biotin carboxyl carrier protein
MPGTIFDIKVTQGQAVKAGDILIILEAMKMENEIVAPVDGTVNSINVTKGQSVVSGDALVTLG